MVLLRERLRAVLIAAVDADELAAVGRRHRRRDLDVWMLARADDAPSEHGFASESDRPVRLEERAHEPHREGDLLLPVLPRENVSTHFGASIAASMARW